MKNAATDTCEGSLDGKGSLCSGTSEKSGVDDSQIPISMMLRALNALLCAFAARGVAGVNRWWGREHGSTLGMRFLLAGVGSVFLTRLATAERSEGMWFDVLLLGLFFVVNTSRGVFPVMMPPRFLLRLFGETMVGVPLPYRRYRSCAYLDYNATSPIFPEVTREMLPYAGECFGNPSSSHIYGRACKAAVDKARERLASLLDCKTDEIVFVASGSEADNHAILAALALFARSPRSGGGSSSAATKPHVVSSSIEHPAVTKCLERLAGEGKVDVTYVGVSDQGRVSVEDVKAALRPTTSLVTIMHSNNEVGALQPVKEIAAICRDRGILCHSDAAQSVGKVVVKVSELGVDMLSVVGHKFGAPKGVAALYVKRGLDLPPMILGGGQESGRRAGTENVMLIAGMGKAAEVVELELEQLSRHMAAMRERLLERIKGRLEQEVTVHGPTEPALRLPNTLSIGVAGLDAHALLGKLSEKVALSAGSACHSGAAHMSGVLKAMGVKESVGLGTLRLSVGRHTTILEVERAVNDLLDAMHALLPKKKAP